VSDREIRTGTCERCGAPAVLDADGACAVYLTDCLKRQLEQAWARHLALRARMETAEREYADVRDAIIAAFDPQDDESAEITILIEAVEDARDHLDMLYEAHDVAVAVADAWRSDAIAERERAEAGSVLLAELAAARAILDFMWADVDLYYEAARKHGRHIDFGRLFDAWAKARGASDAA